jgi:hypothetical protein
MSDLLNEITDECGCINKSWVIEVDKPFCNNEYFSTIERCPKHMKKYEEEQIKNGKIQKRIEELEKQDKYNWNIHKEEIQEVQHTNFTPIKNLYNKLGHKQWYIIKELETLLMITKTRNRFYVSKEKLEKLDTHLFKLIYSYDRKQEIRKQVYSEFHY